MGVEHVSLVMVDHQRGTLWTPGKHDRLVARASLDERGGVLCDAVYGGRTVVVPNSDACARFRATVDTLDMPLPLGVSMMCVPVSHVYAMRVGGEPGGDDRYEAVLPGDGVAARGVAEGEAAPGEGTCGSWPYCVPWRVSVSVSVSVSVAVAVWLWLWLCGFGCGCGCGVITRCSHVFNPGFPVATDAEEQPMLFIRDSQSIDAVIRITSPISAPLHRHHRFLPEALHNAVAAAIKAAARLRDTQAAARAVEAELSAKAAQAAGQASSLQRQVRELQQESKDHAAHAKEVEAEYVWSCCCVWC